MLGSNPFGTDAMAAGYAQARPGVHPRIVERMRTWLPRTVHRALDVGAGAGVSTRALQDVAAIRIGIEPVEAMMRLASDVAAGAMFVVGAAEALPIATGSIDLISAAGSLNYVDLARFLAEAERVLAPHGVLAVYDFSAGRRSREDGALEDWFERFQERYPSTGSEARELNPQVLERVAHGFQMRQSEYVEIDLTMTLPAYLAYMLTETNVAAAVRRGVALAEIGKWCERSLRDVWGDGMRTILFDGYYACLTPIPE